jgi:hypothetical protein
MELWKSVRKWMDGVNKGDTLLRGRNLSLESTLIKFAAFYKMADTRFSNWMSAFEKKAPKVAKIWLRLRATEPG